MQFDVGLENTVSPLCSVQSLLHLAIKQLRRHIQVVLPKSILFFVIFQEAGDDAFRHLWWIVRQSADVLVKVKGLLVDPRINCVVVNQDCEFQEVHRLCLFYKLPA